MPTERYERQYIPNKTFNFDLNDTFLTSSPDTFHLMNDVFKFICISNKLYIIILSGAYF